MNEKIKEWIPAVHLVAFEFNFPGTDHACLISAGMQGVWEGLEKFQAGCGYKLKTFVFIKIRQRMIDYLRSYGYRKGITLPDGTMGSYTKKGCGITHIGLNDPINGIDSYSASDVVPDHHAPSPLESLRNSEVWRLLRDAQECHLLTDKEYEIIYSYFFYGTKLRNIAKKYGCTESHVCQMKKRGLQKLRNVFHEKGVSI